jgi:urease accessory protein
MLLLTQHLTSITDVVPDLTLSLTAEERTRSRYRLTTPEGEEIGLHLPRGTVLQEGDLLTSEDGKTIVRIVARSEPTILVTATHSLDLLRAAYHLGNRHVPLEITPNYLRLSPDPVLESMLIKLGLGIREEIAPFYPEIGAYHGH